MHPRSKRIATLPRDDAPIVELHTLQWGDPARPPLVLLHGGGANAHWWDHIAPHFADRFHVIALDFRGHGDSERPRELAVGAFVRDVEALRASLDDQNVVLIGHSMGAQVALEHVANGAPARALALIDPSRGSDAKPRRRMRLALSFRRTYASREEAIERYRFLPPAEHASETLRRAIATASVEQEDDGRWGYKFDPRWFGLRGGSRPDPRCIGCPTLILRGSESTVLTEAGARSLQAEIDDAQLVVIEDAGHHIQIDRPDALLGALATFLDGLAEV